MANGITVDELVEAFHDSVDNLDCENAEKIVHELKKREQSDRELSTNGCKLLGFNTWGHVIRKIGTWCPKARRNRECIIKELTQYGFDEEYVYVPKVILNADSIEVTKIEGIDDGSKILVKCHKEGYEDYNMIYDRNKVSYLFGKMEKGSIIKEG